jgi:hypothetical protein
MTIDALPYFAQEIILLNGRHFFKVINFTIQFQNPSYNKGNFAELLLRKAPTLG